MTFLSAQIINRSFIETKPEQNQNIHNKKKSAKTIAVFFFLIAASQFHQKIFSEIFFQVSHNPLHLQNSVQSISVFLHLRRLVHFDLHPHLMV